MSRLLVRKTLNLFENEDYANGGKVPIKIAKSSYKRGSSGSKKSKVAAKLKRNEDERFSFKSSIEQLQMKCVLDDVKKRKNVDLTKDNLEVIQRISQTTVVEPVAVDKIISHQTGRLAKNSSSTKVKRKEEETLFTEDDFEKFEKEYFLQT